MKSGANYADAFCSAGEIMPTANSILAELKKKGTAQTQKTYARHGMATEHTFGTSMADIKKIAKTIKGQLELARELFASGKMEAMYLAALVADGARLSAKELDQWAEWASELPMIADYSVPWVTTENPKARELAQKWMKSKKEMVACSGWATYSVMVGSQADEELDLPEIEELLAIAEKEIHSAPNRVRLKMNSFVIAVGCYVKPLHARAKAAAKKIGKVTVDMGDTECKVPSAAEYIEKVVKMGRLGRKRKEIRC